MSFLSWIFREKEVENFDVKGGIKDLDVILEVVHPPKKIKKLSQNKTVLKHLNEFGKITSWEAIKLYRITRLSAIIFNLKEKGHDINSLECISKEGTRFARYILK